MGNRVSSVLINSDSSSVVLVRQIIIIKTNDAGTGLKPTMAI